MTVAIHSFLNAAGGSFAAAPSVGFRLRREISFPTLFLCGELFSSGQNGAAEASPLEIRDLRTLTIWAAGPLRLMVPVSNT
jgi:hypothetical protein